MQELNDKSGGLVLEKGEAAIVTSKNMTRIALYVPDMDGAAQVPPLLLALTAVVVRLQNEPEFLREQIDWMHENRA